MKSSYSFFVVDENLLSGTECVQVLDLHQVVELHCGESQKELVTRGLEVIET